MSHQAPIAAEEAFTAFLRRLSYPTSLLAMSNEGFHAQPGQLSEMFQTVSLWIYEHYTHRLLRDDFLWWADRIPGYTQAITDLTGIPWNCFGFLDGTDRAMAGPHELQRGFYSGHKRNRCLTYITVTAPDGMLLFTAGPANGAHQDNDLLHESGLATELLSALHRRLGDVYCVYGDPIFARSIYVQMGYSEMEINWRQRTFNKAMNSSQVSIEQCFGTITQQWAFLAFTRTQKLWHTRPGLAYMNAQFLANCRNCIRPNQMSLKFKCATPSSCEYLRADEINW